MKEVESRCDVSQCDYPIAYALFTDQTKDRDLQDIAMAWRFQDENS